MRLLWLAGVLLALSATAACAQVMLEYSVPLRNAPRPRVLFPEVSARAPGSAPTVRYAPRGGTADRVERVYARMHQWKVERDAACRKAWNGLTPQAKAAFAALCAQGPDAQRRARTMTRDQALAYLAKLKTEGSIGSVVTNCSLLSPKERAAFDRREQVLVGDMVTIGAPAVPYLMAELEVGITSPRLAATRGPQRVWAVKCLGRMGRPAADALAAFLEREIAAGQRPAPAAQDEAMGAALTALSDAGPPPGGRLAGIARSLLTWPQPWLRVAAVRLLAREQPAEATPVLVQALADADPNVQAVACGLLEEKGDASALPALQALANQQLTERNHQALRTRARAAISAISRRLGAPG